METVKMRGQIIRTLPVLLIPAVIAVLLAPTSLFSAVKPAPYSPANATGMVRIDEKGYIDNTAKWPSPTIPVCWETDVNAPVEQDMVQKAVKAAWTDQTDSTVKFIGWGTCAANAVGVRVTVRDDGEDDGPHTIDLGNRLNGEHDGVVLNFTFQTWGQSCTESNAKRKSCIESIAVHEFGHVLALAHEQNRNDAPGECAALSQGPDGTLPLTPYDPESVMNYCNPVYNNNGKLSKLDIKSIKKAYGGIIQ